MSVLRTIAAKGALDSVFVHYIVCHLRIEYL